MAGARLWADPPLKRQLTGLLGGSFNPAHGAHRRISLFACDALGLDEVGADLRGHRPKSFDDLDDGSFDLVISLTPEAQHRAVELARGRAVEIEYWPVPDPTLVSGSREMILEAYRHSRDHLLDRIRKRFGKTSTFGG